MAKQLSLLRTTLAESNQPVKKHGNFFHRKEQSMFAVLYRLYNYC
jgi:hypothetical protein